MIKILNLEKSFEAEEDLKQIWRYSYNTYGNSQADKYYHEIEDLFDLLSKNPNIGISCDYIKKGYRKYNINKHLAIYRITKDSIYIVRVLSNKMDYSNHL